MVSLKSKIDQRVLGYLVLHEGTEMYINEMCRRFHVNSGNLVRKLQQLEEEGILISRWRGNQRYYSLNSSFPLAKEYKKIILKTIGLEQILKDILISVMGVKKAILFGSYAKNKMDFSSDIDLLVIGNQNTIDLQRKIAKLQKEIDREVNVISMSLDEFERKSEKDPFIKTILKNKKVILL